MYILNRNENTEKELENFGFIKKTETFQSGTELSYYYKWFYYDVEGYKLPFFHGGIIIDINERVTIIAYPPIIFKRRKKGKLKYKKYSKTTMWETYPEVINLFEDMRTKEMIDWVELK